MRLLRGLLGVLLWVLASVLGLVGVLLCVTLILLPVGIPLLMLVRRMYASAVRLMLPRAVAHPVQELGRKGRRGRRKAAKQVPDVGDVAKKGRKALRRQRRRLR